jgi:hypothetical protein
MALPSSTIPTFSGNKCDYPSYRNSLLDCASNASALCIHGHGLLGFLLTAAEWLLLVFVGNAAAFVPLEHPGQRPAAAAGFAAWKFDNDAHQLQQSQIKTFKEHFVASVDATSRQAMQHPVTGTRGHSLADLLTIMDNLHGVLSPSDLTRSSDRLKTPYSLGSPFTDFVRSHEVIHLEAATNGQAMPELHKVRALITAVSHCPSFAARCELWKSMVPTAAAQTFALLATALRSHADTRDSDATAGSHAYANQSLEVLVAAAVAKSFSEHAASATISSRPPRPAPSTPQPRKQLFYCWTHGPCGHQGSECEHPEPGHIPTASFSNQQGGTVERRQTQYHRRRTRN